MECKWVQFDQKGDERGKLIVIEGQKEVPFDIKRIFYMLKTKNDVARGQHANQKSEFVLVNIQGSVKIKVDDGKKVDEYVLDTPDQGLYLPSMVWKEMYDFSEDSMLLVLSNHPYDEFEYIRDYTTYLKLRQETSI